ncbi:MAG: His/Gly/Thr/Pro-type tRNA ligase C-terminal domain-containing protein, partial [Patescibacteria group bacterium]
GIIWPKNVAPYQIHLVSLGKNPEAIKEADKLYEKMKENGVEVLYDDRNESAGVKLKDADLIGIPLRIVISERTLEEKSVEWKLRDSEKSELVKISDIEKKISAL